MDMAQNMAHVTTDIMVAWLLERFPGQTLSDLTTLKHNHEAVILMQKHNLPWPYQSAALPVMAGTTLDDSARLQVDLALRLIRAGQPQATVSRVVRYVFALFGKPGYTQLRKNISERGQRSEAVEHELSLAIGKAEDPDARRVLCSAQGLVISNRQKAAKGVCYNGIVGELTFHHIYEQAKKLKVKWKDPAPTDSRLAIILRPHHHDKINNMAVLYEFLIHHCPSSTKDFWSEQRRNSFHAVRIAEYLGVGATFLMHSWYVFPSHDEPMPMLIYS